MTESSVRDDEKVLKVGTGACCVLKIVMNPQYVTSSKR